MNPYTFPGIPRKNGNPRFTEAGFKAYAVVMVELSGPPKVRLSGVEAVRAIADVVCDYYRMSFERAIQKCRKRELVKVRQIIMFFCREFKKGTLKEVGKVLGGFDHTSVIHSAQTIDEMVATDADYAFEVQQIRIGLYRVL